METADIANSLVSMRAASTQMSVNIAVLKKQFQMEKSVLDVLDPPSPAPAAPGSGQRVDKTA